MLKSQSEKAKIKEAKRKYEVELKELELQVKNLTKINKIKEKEVHQVNKVLENGREKGYISKTQEKCS